MEYKIITKGYRAPISLYDKDNYEIRFINLIDAEDIEAAIKILKRFEADCLCGGDIKKNYLDQQDEY